MILHSYGLPDNIYINSTNQSTGNLNSNKEKECPTQLIIGMVEITKAIICKTRTYQNMFK